jgi:hypothetical protein
MGTPVFVVRDTSVPRTKRVRLQFEHLERMLEDTPLIELPVLQPEGDYPTWYELSGHYLGLKVLLTDEERDAAWRDVKAFRQGRLKENKLSDLSKFLYAFDHFKKINKRRWARETGYDATRWGKIKADTGRLKKRREQNAAVQRRRRLAKRRASGGGVLVKLPTLEVSHPEAAE